MYKSEKGSLLTTVTSVSGIAFIVKISTGSVTAEPEEAALQQWQRPCTEHGAVYNILIS